MLERIVKIAPGTLVATIAAGALASGHASAHAEAGAPGLGASAPPSSLAPVHGHYSPSIEPGNFVTRVNNPLWPLLPGTGFHYRGVRGTIAQRDDEIVTQQKTRILGIACTVVRDTVSERGHAVERTLDYYAQDRQGNVWYMGEDAYELQRGRFVKASDSWRAGVNGGKPGIIMPATPKAGDRYRQEYYPPGKALDEADVVGYRGPVTVPYGTFKRVLATSEFSPLEPQTERKYYVRGVGEISERVVKGQHEEFQLVSVTH